MLKSGKKILSLVLSVCMLICLIPTAVFASDSGGYMKIAMLDCGRKYFTVDWVKSLIYEAKADGFTHVMLAVGNDGMRFLLDDMSLTVGSKTYKRSSKGCCYLRKQLIHHCFNRRVDRERNERDFLCGSFLRN